MKIIFVSDIHGSLSRLEKVAEFIKSENPDNIVMLGDALYHGPRNPLPEEYNPSAVALLLNQFKDKITAVRGNCDSEVDQMLIDYPMMADYSQLFIDGKKWFATHGHLYQPESSFPSQESFDVFISGHTHLPVLHEQDGKIIFNPGSISLPKGGNEPTFGMYENLTFKLMSLEGEPLEQLEIINQK
ncbi:phosphodiesterase [Aureibacter tunicatorum]|uniref:Phosphoesterase n=1 Tax=Aureibacter tunicatorum TaxID=866807 RepID=A0AAE3XM13_9BACT|nr:phosphodiesterase [Aureibacter tunicatorum]MDR6238261.1 hypothetical protein [Aureibacter tunicatorum]BDD03294.1 phosphoesterase [Aureibacter tunicatorum]